MIEAIFIAKEAQGEQLQVDSIEVAQTKGIVGDRNFNNANKPGKNITFVELEEIEKYNEAFSQSIELHATRRNIITKEVRLNDLVGKEFVIGDVKFKGVEFCEPCAMLGSWLENKTIKKEDVVKAFIHKGGLRADVLSSGVIKLGMNFRVIGFETP